MLTELRRSVLFTLTTMLLFGGVYHGALWALGEAVFPSQVEGSLIRRGDGTVVGSRLIAQRFLGPGYFHPRPSAVDYNAASTGGSNFGPSNPEHLAEVRTRLSALTALEDVPASQVPAAMVTASGSGLDPDIPIAAAELQARRVAEARNLSVESVRTMIERHTQQPALGFLGTARVNVLELNLALDAAPGAAATDRER